MENSNISLESNSIAGFDGVCRSCNSRRQTTDVASQVSRSDICHRRICVGVCTKICIFRGHRAVGGNKLVESI